MFEKLFLFLVFSLTIIFFLDIALITLLNNKLVEVDRKIRYDVVLDDAKYLEQTTDLALSKEDIAIVKNWQDNHKICKHKDLLVIELALAELSLESTRKIKEKMTKTLTNQEPQYIEVLTQQLAEHISIVGRNTHYPIDEQTNQFLKKIRNPNSKKNPVFLKRNEPDVLERLFSLDLKISSHVISMKEK